MTCTSCRCRRCRTCSTVRRTPYVFPRFPGAAEVLEIDRGSDAVRIAVAVRIDPSPDLGEFRHVVVIELHDIVVREVQLRVDRGLLANRGIRQERIDEKPLVLEGSRPPDDIAPHVAAGGGGN